MSSPVAELEAGLQAMLSLKPPGVTGSRIQSITALCKANVQSESVLIQKLFTHFKKAPGTHKLGVLYVVDSVTREWMVQAKAAGQPINSSALDGTYAAGVNRVKELLPVLMNDILQSAPDEQKGRIKKLIDIWEKGQTFPSPLLTSFKAKLNASMQNRSTTPEGSPPPDLQLRLGLQQPNAPATAPPAPAPAAAPNTASILEALVNIARQNTSTAPNVPTAQTQNSSHNVSNAHNVAAQHAPALNQTVPFPAFSQPVNVPAAPATFASQGPSNGVQNGGSNQSSLFPGMPSLVPPPPGGVDQQTAILVKMLADRGMTAEQIAGIVTPGNQAGQPAPPPQYPAQNLNQIAQNGHNGRGGRPDESRDRNGFQDHESLRSPPLYRRRSRSPSPVRGWNARDSPASRRRDEQSFEYGRGRDSPGRGRDDDRGGRGGRGRGNEYRQRSPPRRRGRSPTPPRSRDAYGGLPKWVDYDDTIPNGSIKVLSRTLFVGGVNSSEQELRSVFDRFGKVQTCIVNKDKRHAFVKMISRRDAVTAKEAMGENRSQDPHSKQRSFNQTRWGVGFGPRDCSDYTTGISVIPISKLTDADRKWMVTAEYGGTGGKPIESGMVVEEPDIEIGQGVSSKAISRRMQTDRGGNNGSKSGRDRGDREDDDGSRYHRSSDRDDRRDDDRRDKSKANGASSAMPSFPMPGMPGFAGMPGMPGFPMPTLPNGMPMFPMPPGFSFPGMPAAPGHNGQAFQQPPPPGRD